MHRSRANETASAPPSASPGRAVLFALALGAPVGVAAAAAALFVESGPAAGLMAALTYAALQGAAAWYLWRRRSSPDEITRHERDADQRFLAALVQEMQEGVVTVDRGGVVRTWSPGAERMFGWDAAETIGHPLADFLAAAIPRGDLEATAAGLPRTETRGPRKDGQGDRL